MTTKHTLTTLIVFSASKMPNGQEILFSAELKSAGQSVTCYAMCDDIGTQECP